MHKLRGHVFDYDDSQRIGAECFFEGGKGDVVWSSDQFGLGVIYEEPAHHCSDPQESQSPRLKTYCVLETID